MDIRIKKYLYDMYSAILDVEEFTSDMVTFSDYTNNKLVKRAVEREFEILGEAMNRILSIDESFQITDAKKIVGLRNNVIHGYDKIDDGVLWNVIKNYLPTLKKEVHTLLPYIFE